jgi:hypothetical protein
LLFKDREALMESRNREIRRHVEYTAENAPMESAQAYIAEERVQEMERQVLANTLYFIDHNYHELSKVSEEHELSVLREKRERLLAIERSAFTSLRGECEKVREDVSRLKEALSKRAPVNLSLLGIIEGAVLGEDLVLEEKGARGGVAGGADNSREVDVYFTDRELPEIGRKEVERVQGLLHFIKSSSCREEP